MKKNVKILGAAAAALLAVAPVAASATGSALADVTVPVIVSGGAKESSAITLTLKVANQYAGDASKMTATLSSTTGTPQINKNDGRVVVYKSGDATVGSDGYVSFKPGVKPVDTLEAGQKYVAVAEGVSIKNAGKAGTDVYINGTKNTLDEYGDATKLNLNIGAEFTAYNPDLPGTPYFVYGPSAANGKKGQQVNGTVEAPKNLDYSTVANLLSAINSGQIIAANPGNVKNTDLLQNANITESELVDLLRSQNLLASDGTSIKAPSEGFNLTISKYFGNGKAATATIHFPGSNDNGAPIFYEKPNSTQWQKRYANGVLVVEQGTKWDSAIASNVFAAYISKNDRTRVHVYTVTNNVNTSVPGIYSVTLGATNTATNKTSYKTFQVLVQGNGEKTINYVPGYGVLVWSVDGNTASSTGRTVYTGTAVKTGESTVVDGVSYTKVSYTDQKTGAGITGWVQTQYLSDAWKIGKQSNTNKPSNSSEEKASGVATVTYKGRGGVNLLNAEGKYQNQYVKKGSAWKVFAKKTINGETMYRLGTQSQWIPAKYVSVK